MVWIFASVVLILVATVPGWWRKIAVVVAALVIAFYVTL